ncbi:hypothetical protein M2451_003357 [Dysgonomonas sp. PFB1-18]|uniref:XAC2610-related protein n=1 Tax=unclassified Dysgonomonas TaxID=2630389 RepID=UPI0024740A5D|nr:MULTISPECIES: hypothetical protein [unclassified Dysgonomonas]MDH6310553.1 hypothetical protein [Dysgonomonas sp. PF1-14]MDH6340403.1 hypothetical protein [Dysgonomonas sp. PF1-16]MDH6382017.1 hypothetical protein [Dysgonomonas sp. PFB1-18]MDH6399374.1 hypothetical protein [Dysgonomonas sp. PF1-23]
MRQLFFICILVNLSLLSYSQTVATYRLTVPFSGFVDKYPIEMTLEIYPSQNGYVSGMYKYAKSKSKNYLSLEGNIAPSGNIKLEESYYDPKADGFRVSGYFSGSIDNGYNISGNWADSAATKSLQLALTPKLKEFHNGFRFELVTTSDFDDDDVDKIYYSLLTDVIIRNTDGKEIQTLTGIDRYVQKDNEADDIELADYNFDGYPDIAVYYAFPGRTKYDWGQLYFLYNPQTGKFERNLELERYERVSVNYFDYTLGVSFADGSGNESDYSYIYQDGHYYLIKEDHQTEEGKSTIINYEVKGGKSVEVSRKTMEF